MKLRLPMPVGLVKAGLGMHLRYGKQRDVFHWQHLLAWLGGILCALVPFFWAWELGGTRIPLRNGAGNFGFNILVATGLGCLGAMAGGYWWRFGKWLVGRRDLVISVAAVLLLLLGLVGLCVRLQPDLFLSLVIGLIVLSLVFAFIQRNVRKRDWPGWFHFLEWLDDKGRLNGVFYLVLLLMLLINNLSLIWGMDAGSAERVSIFIGRFFTHALVVGSVYLLAELAIRSAPRYLCWVPWIILALVPLLVILDQILGIMWNRTLINVINSLTASGKLNLAIELSTSGLEVGPLGAWLMVIGVFGAAMLVARACWLVSLRYNMRLSIGGCLVFMLLCWLVVVIEQGIGSQWKKMTVRQEERKSFALNIGVFPPPEGLGKYRIAFHDGMQDDQVEIPRLSSKPDIFIFMLESVRSDALRPDTAPFLCRFRDEDSQPFTGTWAASNATHLSWFGFFHSRIPVFWREALEAIEERQKFAGALPLQQLRQAGYEIEARAVCDLGYKDFGFSNFGYEKNLVNVLQQAREGDALSRFPIPERERMVMEDLIQSVAARPQGGLYVTALDSPHYNYFWHVDFDPPFKDYDEDISFPLNPDQDEIQRVVNRYWNSVAWVDQLLEKFCDFLKSEGRYKNSIIIITGDHGEEFQEQGSWFHCSSLRPEQIGVPILIKWPDHIGRGPEQHNVNHVDVMPSLLYALGMPEEVICGMAGRNLLVKSSQQTSVSTTAYVGESGETMVLHRAGYEAVFFWERYWESNVPTEVVLENLTDPDGNMVRLKDAAAYADELRLRFPDAFERFFESLEVIKK